MKKAVLLVLWCLLGIPAASAQDVPGPADASRIEIPADREAGPEKPAVIQLPASEGDQASPEGSDDILFTLKSVEIEGSSVYDPARLESLYRSYLGREVPLSTVWTIANALTTLYRNDGYFLSRAYIPAQEIDDGDVTISVVEGYVGLIEFTDPHNGNALARKFGTRLLTQRPVRSQDLESFLLYLNDLPGYEFRGVLSRAEQIDVEGATKLTLFPENEAYSAIIGADNYGSRFLGPHEMSASFSHSFIPGQQTTVSAFGSAPMKELQYMSAEHSVYLAPDWSVKVEGSFSNARPGDFLSSLEVESRSFFAGASLTYQWIRQRDENLSLSVGFRMRNSRTEIFDQMTSEDNIRSVYASLDYDVQDSLGGMNVLNVGLFHGLDVLGSNEAGDPDASRLGTAPDFMRATLSATRLQRLTDDIDLVASVAGQIASRSLYSSEEFGYGGQFLGRAYDSSELTGDNGAAAGVEMRYRGMKTDIPLKIVPYLFFDIGKVWSESSGQDSLSGSSAGFGARISTADGLSGNIGLAFPLTKGADDPVYGGGSHDPRLLIEITHKF